MTPQPIESPQIVFNAKGLTELAQAAHGVIKAMSALSDVLANKLSTWDFIDTMREYRKRNAAMPDRQVSARENRARIKRIVKRVGISTR